MVSRNLLISFKVRIYSIICLGVILGISYRNTSSNKNYGTGESSCLVEVVVTISLWVVGTRYSKTMVRPDIVSGIFHTGSSIITKGINVMKIFQGDIVRKLSTKLALCRVSRNLDRKFCASQHLLFSETIRLRHSHPVHEV